MRRLECIPIDFNRDKIIKRFDSRGTLLMFPIVIAVNVDSDLINNNSGSFGNYGRY